MRMRGCLEFDDLWCLIVHMCLLAIFVLKVDLLPLIFQLADVHTSQLPFLLDPLAKLIQNLLMIDRFLDPEFKSLLSLSLHLPILFLQLLSFGLLLFLFLDIRRDGLIIDQFSYQFFLLQFEMLVIFEEVGKKGDGKLWSLMIDMRESLSNDVADLGMAL